MQDPARAERRWLALAVATRWLVRSGGADEAGPEAALPELQVLSAARPKTQRWRLLSVFARGWVVILVALLNHERLPQGHMLPEPWPIVPSMPGPTEAQSEIKLVA
jgi:hypothetical protein